MSLLRFFTRRGKPEDSPERRKGDKREGEDAAPVDPEAEKRRLKHSLSISRSGRFKQKKRERSGVLDKPELFDGPGSAQGGSGGSNPSSSPSSSAPHTRSPGPACRSTHPRGSGMAMGPSVPSVAS